MTRLLPVLWAVVAGIGLTAWLVQADARADQAQGAETEVTRALRRDLRRTYDELEALRVQLRQAQGAQATVNTILDERVMTLLSCLAAPPEIPGRSMLRRASER